MKMNPMHILFGDRDKKPPVLLAVTPPRTGERTLLGVENLLQSIAVPEPFSLELAGSVDGVTLLARCHQREAVQGQIAAHYPQARITEVPPDDDPLRLREGEQAWGMSLTASGPEFVPLRTFRDDDLLDPGSDPLIALLGVLENGVYTPRGKAEPELSLSEVAGMAHQVGGRLLEMEYGLDESSFYYPPGLTYSSGTYVVVVEVDSETGDVELNKFFCVDDQGVVVNPTIVDGQVHRGAAQGIGQALCEEIIYDGGGAQMLNGSLMDYGLPTAEMVPPFVTSRLETPSPMNPLGVKGMGEGPTVGTPPAIVNAVIDALEPFGVCHIKMPLTPERVLRAINEGRAVQSAG